MLYNHSKVRIKKGLPTTFLTAIFRSWTANTRAKNISEAAPPSFSKEFNGSWIDESSKSGTWEHLSNVFHSPLICTRDARAGKHFLRGFLTHFAYYDSVNKQPWRVGRRGRIKERSENTTRLQNGFENQMNVPFEFMRNGEWKQILANETNQQLDIRACNYQRCVSSYYFSGLVEICVFQIIVH